MLISIVTITTKPKDLGANLDWRSRQFIMVKTKPIPSSTMIQRYFVIAIVTIVTVIIITIVRLDLT